MRALLLVDLQNDFMPGGSLAVSDGDATVSVANSLIERFELVVATQDWHPADHGSFASNHAGLEAGQCVELCGLPQVLWPAHCVQGSEGAAFHPLLERGYIERVFQKGCGARVDSYSGFHDNQPPGLAQRSSTGMGEWLREWGVKELWVMGLATDYCLKFTVLDALREGFAVRLVEAGCRAVELQEGDGARAIAEMQAAGAQLAEVAQA